MRKFYIIFSIAILCFGAVLMSGCAQTGTVPVTPTPTATQAPTMASATPTVQVPVPSTPVSTLNVYTEASNGTTVSVPANGIFVVMLQENPTTGFVWNVTVTDGLKIVNTTFIPPTSGLMGAGGVRTWGVQAIQTGKQQFNGVYKQPFENLTGNETTFVLTVNVI